MNSSLSFTIPFPEAQQEYSLNEILCPNKASFKHFELRSFLLETNEALTLLPLGSFI